MGDLTPADKDALRRVREIFDSRIQVGCTGCGYCLPCPQQVAIPKIFAYWNDYYLADDKAVKERARFVHDFTVGEHERADKCVNCGACIEECPQHIAIPDKLAEADKLFRASAE